MAPPKRPWLRLYVEMVHDRKLRTRPLADRWLWVVLMTMAGSSAERGRIMLAADVPADVAVIADEANISIEQAAPALAYFESVGMVAIDEDGAYWLPHFLERQFESDNSTERVERFRARTKETAVDEPSSADETPKERLQRAETETKKDLVRAVDADFDVFWLAYPRKVGKPRAEKAYRTARKHIAADAILSGLAQWVAAWRAEGTQQQFIPHPSTWLNDCRWADAPSAARGTLARASPRSLSPDVIAAARFAAERKHA